MVELSFAGMLALRNYPQEKCCQKDLNLKVLQLQLIWKKNLHNGPIIDITADQFADYDILVYVGYQDSFHQSFDFIEAYDYDGLNDGRLYSLYRTIKEYL